MSHHSFPRCFSYSERCWRCCGSCKGKPRAPVGGFSLPLVQKEEVAEDSAFATVKAS